MYTRTFPGSWSIVTRHIRYFRQRIMNFQKWWKLLYVYILIRVLKVKLVETFPNFPLLSNHPSRKSCSTREFRRGCRKESGKKERGTRGEKKKWITGFGTYFVTGLWEMSRPIFFPCELTHIPSRTRATNFRRVRLIRYRKRTFRLLSFLDLRPNAKTNWAKENFETYIYAYTYA